MYVAFCCNCVKFSVILNLLKFENTWIRNVKCQGVFFTCWTFFRKKWQVPTILWIKFLNPNAKRSQGHLSFRFARIIHETWHQQTLDCRSENHCKRAAFFCLKGSTFGLNFEAQNCQKSFDLSTYFIKRKTQSYPQKCQSTDNLFSACHLFPSSKRQIEKKLSDPINIRPIWIERSNEKKKCLFAPKTNE